MTINIPGIPERTLVDLPNEVLLQILGYLSPLELYISVITVSKKLHHVSPKACAGLKWIEKGPRVNWDHIPTIIGWSPGPRACVPNELVLKTEDPRYILAQMALPSLCRMRVNVFGELKFIEYRSISISNITVFELTCCSIEEEALHLVLGALSGLTRLALKFTFGDNHDIFTPLIEKNAATLTSLKAKSSYGTFRTTKRIADFKKLRECVLDWPMVFNPDDDNKPFHQIFPPAIERIRLWARGTLCSSTESHEHVEETDFLEDVRKLSNRDHLVLGESKTQLYEWNCPIKQPSIFRTNHDSSCWAIDPHGTIWATVNTKQDKNP